MAGMTRPLVIPIGPEARERLLALAAAERRSPRQQAAVMLERALGLKPTQLAARDSHELVAKDTRP